MDDTLHLYVPSDYLRNADGEAHSYVTNAVRMTYRHEWLHGVAVDIRHTDADREAYHRGDIEVTDPLAVGTDLHEAMTAFLTNALAREGDVSDVAYIHGQRMLLLCAMGLERDGVSDPIAHMTRVYFNEGHPGWTSLVERAGRALAAAGLVTGSDALQVALNRLPDPTLLEQGSEHALESRARRFRLESGYDPARVGRDGVSVARRTPMLAELFIRE
jgi:hypothetical protein